MRAHSVTKNSRLLTHAVTTALFLSALATEISLAASGDLDSSFGAGGVVALTINDHAYATAVAVQDDDKIVAAGYSLSGSSGRIAVVRLDAVGDLDAAFGSAGVVSIPATNQSIGYAVALQSDANILVAGGEFTGPDGPDYDFRLVRLLASDGRLDASFGSGGIVATAAASRVGAAAIAVQADGKILVGGDGNPKPQSTSRNRDLLVVRYDTDGTLDSTYGVGGKAFVSMGKSHEYLNRLVAQTDGSVLAAGSAGAKSSWRPVATRLGSAGALSIPPSARAAATGAVGSRAARSCRTRRCSPTAAFSLRDSRWWRARKRYRPPAWCLRGSPRTAVATRASGTTVSPSRHPTQRPTITSTAARFRPTGKS